MIGHEDILYAAALSPDGRGSPPLPATDRTRLGCRDRSRDRGSCVATGLITSATFSADGTHVATALGRQDRAIWDRATGQGDRLLSGHTMDVKTAVFSPDGSRYPHGAIDGTRAHL